MSRRITSIGAASASAKSREGLAAVIGLHRLVAQAAQQTGEQLAIEGRVVDDEDPTGRRVPVERRHQPAPPATAGRARSSAALSSSGRIGLLT